MKNHCKSFKKKIVLSDSFEASICFLIVYGADGRQKAIRSNRAKSVILTKYFRLHNYEFNLGTKTANRALNDLTSQKCKVIS